MKPSPDSMLLYSTTTSQETSSWYNSLNEILYYALCPQPTLHNVLTIGLVFPTEILDVILMLHSTNLVVAIISKVIGYMLGYWQLLPWSQ